jgi:RNA polymerase sigma factor (sigma-70 family)
VTDLGELIERYQRVANWAAHNVCASTSSQWHDDIRSAAQVALWRALVSHDPERGDLERWLRIKVRNACLDERRRFHGRRPSERTKALRHPVSLDAEVEDDLTLGDLVADPVDPIAQTDDRLLLAALWRQLNDRERQLCASRLIGMTNTEIARADGVTQSAITHRFYAIRGKVDAHQ